jgi:hypothetical protein
MNPRCDILMLYASLTVYCPMVQGCMVWYRLQYLVLTLLCLVSVLYLAVTSRGYCYMGSGVKGHSISVALSLVILMTHPSPCFDALYRPTFGLLSKRVLLGQGT